ncbi:MAG TPA: hypothetical protein VGE11_25075 [Pseudonocardia sp.]
MSNPTADDAFLHDLEGTVRDELALADRSQPEDEPFGAPIEQWLFDPADVEREEIGLRSLLGAVEALEGTEHRPSRSPAIGEGL